MQIVQNPMSSNEDVMSHINVITTFIEQGIKIKDVACGEGFSVYLTSDGKVYGSGHSPNGQLGGQWLEPFFIPTPLLFGNDTSSPITNIL